MTIVKQFIVLLSNCFVSIYQDNPIFLWELGQYLVLDFRTQNCCTSELILLGHTAESSNGKLLSTEPFPIWTRIDHVKPHSTHYRPVSYSWKSKMCSCDITIESSAENPCKMNPHLPYKLRVPFWSRLSPVKTIKTHLRPIYSTFKTKMCTSDPAIE